MNIGYFVRFDVLHTWFEKYNIKTKKAQKSYPSIAKTASMLESFENYPDSYDFVYSGEDLEENLAKMVNDMVEIATYFFNNHRSLEDLYAALIVPVLEGKKEFPDVGADWIFEYLTLTKLVDSENYEKVKELILDRIDFLLYRRSRYPELNIKEYEDKLDEIFKYLEALELEMSPAFPPL